MPVESYNWTSFTTSTIELYKLHYIVNVSYSTLLCWQNLQEDEGGCLSVSEEEVNETIQILYSLVCSWGLA